MSSHTSVLKRKEEARAKSFVWFVFPLSYIVFFFFSEGHVMWEKKDIDFSFDSMAKFNLITGKIYVCWGNV